MRNLKNKNIEVQQISKEQDSEDVINFINVHGLHNGNIFDHEFNVMDITCFCKNFDESNKLFLLGSFRGWVYFYTSELGLIEMKEKNGAMYIPDFLPIEPDEFSVALQKRNEYGEIVSLLSMNPVDKNKDFDSITIGTNTINCVGFASCDDGTNNFRLLVVNTNEEGENKEYEVEEYFHFDENGDIEYEYKKIKGSNEKKDIKDLLASRPSFIKRSDFEIELKNLLLENGNKDYVNENELEYGYCYDIEAHNFLNHNYTQIIEFQTEKAFLIDITKVWYFDDLKKLPNFNKINPKQWIPKSMTLYNDEHILWINEYILEKVHSTLMEEINDLNM
jgi:hypothetical protein